MVFDERTGLLQFEAGAGYISRADVSGRQIAM
jgi:hypothetical protein